jgi:hypothetical protein
MFSTWMDYVQINGMYECFFMTLWAARRICALPSLAITRCTGLNASHQRHCQGKRQVPEAVLSEVVLSTE